jgi:hypothetical protein
MREFPTHASIDVHASPSGFAQGTLVLLGEARVEGLRGRRGHSCS